MATHLCEDLIGELIKYKSDDYKSDALDRSTISSPVNHGHLERRLHSLSLCVKRPGRVKNWIFLVSLLDSEIYVSDYMNCPPSYTCVSRPLITAHFERPGRVKNWIFLVSLLDSEIYVGDYMNCPPSYTSHTTRPLITAHFERPGRRLYELSTLIHMCISATITAHFERPGRVKNWIFLVSLLDSEIYVSDYMNCPPSYTSHTTRPLITAHFERPGRRLYELSTLIHITHHSATNHSAFRETRQSKKLDFLVSLLDSEIYVSDYMNCPPSYTSHTTRPLITAHFERPGRDVSMTAEPQSEPKDWKVKFKTLLLDVFLRFAIDLQIISSPRSFHQYEDVAVVVRNDEWISVSGGIPMITLVCMDILPHITLTAFLQFKNSPNRVNWGRSPKDQPIRQNRNKISKINQPKRPAHTFDEEILFCLKEKLLPTQFSAGLYDPGAQLDNRLDCPRLGLYLAPANSEAVAVPRRSQPNYGLLKPDQLFTNIISSVCTPDRGWNLGLRTFEESGINSYPFGDFEPVVQGSNTWPKSFSK
ncbi:hypothetical protein J6590_045979, partial [Homalodisca vitripennis]